MYLTKDMKFLKKHLTLSAQATPGATYFGGTRCLEDAIYKRTIADLFDGDIREEKAFFRHIEAVRPNMYAAGQNIIKDIEAVLAAYHETISAIAAVETTSKATRVYRSFLSRLRADVDRLVPKDFVAVCEKERLQHLPRYLKALKIRVQRGLVDLEKDRAKEHMIREFTQALTMLTSTLPSYSSEEKKDALNELSWMVEEYRVSLFAQELKTAFPVSPKRIREKIKEIERIV
jgi:ATP-dependent helicase HrpA